MNTIDRRCRAAVRVIVALTCLTTLAVLASAGPLNPPAGAISASGKTLNEAEPRTPVTAANTPGDSTSQFVISQSGSYYLTGNIAAPAARNGIKITAANVTLDLRGFTLTGAAGSSAGIALTAAAQRVNIANGTIAGFGLDGIDGGFNLHGRFERITASGNGASSSGRLGIRVGGSCEVIDCDASNNTGGGIGCNEACSVTGCTVASNTSTGISTGEGSTITGCAAYQNGSHGISAGAGNTIAGCTAKVNGATGIRTLLNCAVTGSTTTANSGNGVWSTGGCTLSDCTASANVGTGFELGDNNAVSRCLVTQNGQNGVVATSNTVVTGCEISRNGQDGIACGSRCTLTGNGCTENAQGGSGAGIHVQGAQCRVEQNTCTGATRGVEVSNTGTIVIRNTCAGNTVNWVIAANNLVGPIIDRTAPASGAISGNSAASTLGSTDPNANFSH